MEKEGDQGEEGRDQWFVRDKRESEGGRDGTGTRGRKEWRNGLVQVETGRWQAFTHNYNYTIYVCFYAMQVYTTM